MPEDGLHQGKFEVRHFLIAFELLLESLNSHVSLLKPIPSVASLFSSVLIGKKFTKLARDKLVLFGWTKRGA
ncbi:unnamed protein product [Linum trigynum]|uniref:Uncharacterized protein n=1 Tax=Linum trigynum TaxID=586398 RepID=A0AAV2CQW5_9ROSI